MLSREGIEGVLINSQHNFAWITAGASNGIDLSRDMGAASILVTNKGKRYLLTNNIEMQRMFAEQVSSDEFESVEYRWQDDKVSPSFVIDKAKDIADGQVAADVSIESRIAECRYSFTDDEVERFRKLGNDVAAPFSRTIETISPGMSETEIANTMRFELASENITSVVTLVAADDRIAKYRHPVPSDDRWEKTLLLVTCAKRGGLIASMSRMISVGQPSDELKRKTEAGAFVNASLQNATRVGALGSELYIIASRAYEHAGFASEINNHHQGGAAGYRTREWVAHPASGETVRRQQAFAWNPSITGTKVEDTIITTDGGAEVITISNDFPTIETEIDGNAYFSHGILSI